MVARIFVIPGSHPSRAAMLMLDRKGIPYKRRDLVNAVHRPILRAAGFPGITVPAIKIDGRRLQGTREIARALDEMVPDPPLFPGDPEQRARVEEAEAWGDEFQSVPRRIVWNALPRADHRALRSFLKGAKIGLPHGLAARTAAPLVWMSGRHNEASDENVRADLAALPGNLDRIERWMADGVIGGEQPNAADFQIATSVRLLLTIEDVRQAIEDRRCARWARELVPDYPGLIPAVLPKDWLEPLRTERAAA